MRTEPKGMSHRNGRPKRSSGFYLFAKNWKRTLWRVKIDNRLRLFRVRGFHLGFARARWTRFQRRAEHNRYYKTATGLFG